jgi:hypothetical protein
MVVLIGSWIPTLPILIEPVATFQNCPNVRLNEISIFLIIRVVTKIGQVTYKYSFRTMSPNLCNAGSVISYFSMIASKVTFPAFLESSAPWDDKRNRLLCLGKFQSALGWQEFELGLFIDKAQDQPSAGGTVNPDSLSRSPLQCYVLSLPYHSLVLRLKRSFSLGRGLQERRPNFAAY